MNSLDKAPDHVKLAVDLIMLLEQHDIDPKKAIRALKIVIEDCERKVEHIASAQANYV